MRTTILPMADILTKAHRAAVSFLFLLPTYIHICANIMQYTHIHDTDKREVLQQEYSQPPIFPSPQFRWAENACIGGLDQRNPM